MSSQTGTLAKIRTNFSSFEEMWLFIQIFLLITVLPLMLKLLCLPRLMKLLTSRDLKVYENLDVEKSKDKVVKFTDYILGRNFWIYENTCLKRSLILYYFLRKLGMNVYICFGVRYNDHTLGEPKKLEGHAWLRFNGTIFLERNVKVARAYTMTCCFP